MCTSTHLNTCWPCIQPRVTFIFKSENRQISLAHLFRIFQSSSSLWAYLSWIPVLDGWFGSLLPGAWSKTLDLKSKPQMCPPLSSTPPRRLELLTNLLDLFTLGSYDALNSVRYSHFGWTSWSPQVAGVLIPLQISSKTVIN